MCISFPINDDPRLQIDIGDEILVTHWHKRWLYGQKISKNSKIRLKGWFPEKCAVVLVKPIIANSDNELDKEIIENEIPNCGDSKKQN